MICLRFCSFGPNGTEVRGLVFWPDLSFETDKGIILNLTSVGMESRLEKNKNIALSRFEI